MGSSGRGSNGGGLPPSPLVFQQWPLQGSGRGQAGPVGLVVDEGVGKGKGKGKAPARAGKRHLEPVSGLVTRLQREGESCCGLHYIGSVGLRRGGRQSLEKAGIDVCEAKWWEEELPASLFGIVPCWAQRGFGLASVP